MTLFGAKLADKKIKRFIEREIKEDKEDEPNNKIKERVTKINMRIKTTTIIMNQIIIIQLYFLYSQFVAEPKVNSAQITNPTYKVT